MAKYRLTDPSSGRTVTVSGDKPPTQQDADAIFSHINTESAPKAEKSPIGQAMDFIGGAADVFVPQTKKAITTGYQDLQAKDAARQATNPSKGNIVNATVNAAASTKDLFDVAAPGGLELGSYTAPVGKGIKAMLGFGGISGLLKTLSEGDVTPEKLASGVTTGAATNAVFGGASKVVGKALGKTGEIIEKEAKKLPLGGIKITPTQMADFFGKHKTTVEDFIKNEKLSGNPTKLAQQGAEKLQEQYDNLVSRADVPISKEDLANSFNKQINMFLNDPNYKFVEEAKQLAEKLAQKRDFMLQAFGDNENITAAQLIKIRRLTDELISPNKHMADPLTANINVQTRRILNDTVYGKVGQDEAKAMGKKLSMYYDFLDKTKKTDMPTAKSRLNDFGKGSIVALALSNPQMIPALLAGMVVKNAASNPAVVDAESKIAEKVGQGMQKASGAQLPDFLIKMIRGAATGKATGSW